jgi:hypothetical protein
MAQWDGSNKAPKGQYRMIGTDTFPWPHEDYWIGDFASLPEAKELANTRSESMNVVAVYDENGTLLFPARTDDPKV